jgi:ubiquinone/menaquinone biosynthesis C-methylase UbiE
MASIGFDRAADYYDETRGFPLGEEKPAAELLTRAGKLTHSSRVCEVGVGTGRIALPLARHVGTVYGIDLSRAMMQRLEAKRHGEPVYLVEGDITRLPFQAGVFDAAVAVHIFHLIPNWQDALREVRRVLRPNGLLLTAYNKGSVGFDRLWEAWDAEFSPDRKPNIGVQPNHYYDFPLEEGWQPVGDMLAYEYAFEQAPAAFVRLLERRVWSSLWKLSDAQLQRGIARVKAAIQTQFGDPDTPVRVAETFYVRAFLPPQ